VTRATLVKVLHQHDVAFHRVSPRIDQPAAIGRNIHAHGGANRRAKISVFALLSCGFRIIPSEATGRDGSIQNTDIFTAHAESLKSWSLDHTVLIFSVQITSPDGPISVIIESLPIRGFRNTLTAVFKDQNRFSPLRRNLPDRRTGNIRAEIYPAPVMRPARYGAIAPSMRQAPRRAAFRTDQVNFRVTRSPGIKCDLRAIRRPRWRTCCLVP